MLDALAFPGVGDVDQALAGLDDGGVGEFLPGLVFERQRRVPVLAVPGHGDVEGTAALSGVIINQELAAIAQGDGINAGIG